MASNPNNDYATDCQQSKSVGDRIQAISTVSTVEVSREDYNDGAGGLDYLITFTGNDGNLMDLIGTDSNLFGTGATPQGGQKTALIKQSKIQNGNFVGGTFSVSLASKTRQRNWSYKYQMRMKIHGLMVV